MKLSRKLFLIAKTLLAGSVVVTGLKVKVPGSKTKEVKGHALRKGIDKLISMNLLTGESQSGHQSSVGFASFIGEGMRPLVDYKGHTVDKTYSIYLIQVACKTQAIIDKAE